MQMIAFSYPTLAVSTIYGVWLAYRRALLQRERTLRERVAYMLWVLASRMPTEPACDETDCTNTSWRFGKRS
jgi:hypothetical protein